MSRPKFTPPPKGTFEIAGRQFPRVSWRKSRSIRLLYVYIFFLCLVNAGNGFDGSMMNGLQTLSYWRDYFGHPTGSLLGVLNCIFSVGSVAGLPCIAFFSDRYGRRIGLLVGSVIMLIGTALQGSSTSIGMFLAARFLVGFGDAIAIAVAPLLITEIAHTQNRAIMVSAFSVSYFLGAIFASWSTYGTLTIQSNWAWRAPSLIQGFFSLITIAVLYWIPESPRYYIDRDESEKALQILADIHADGDTENEAVRLEFSEICHAIALDKSMANTYGWLDFVKTKGNRKRLAIILSIGFFSQWSGNGLVSYYINLVLNNIGITNSKTQLLINGGLTIFNFAINSAFCFFVDKLGRRPLYLVSTIGMFFSFVVWTILSARYNMTLDNGLGTGVVVMIFVYNFFYDVKTGLLTMYTAEILPYGLRAKGMTLLYLFVDLSLFFNQYVNPVALGSLGWKYYIFYCVFLAFEIIVLYYIIVETRYTPLEEIIKFFDGEEMGEVIVSGKTEAIETEYVEATVEK